MRSKPVKPVNYLRTWRSGAMRQKPWIAAPPLDREALRTVYLVVRLPPAEGTMQRIYSTAAGQSN